MTPPSMTATTTTTTGLDAVNDFLGMGASAFTAHPHVDPIRKRLVGWTWTNLPRSDSMRIG